MMGMGWKAGSSLSVTSLAATEDPRTPSAELIASSQPSQSVDESMRGAALGRGALTESKWD